MRNSNIESLNETYFKSLKYYKLISRIILIISVFASTWIFKSGLIELWDRHPNSPVPEFSWVSSIVLGLIVGFIIWVLLLLQLEITYDNWVNSRRKKE